jgi:Protein of unknown function (DUF2586)
MADINVTILDGQLGLVSAVGDQAIVHAGVCSQGTPNTVYGVGSIPFASATLGVGTLVEDCADTISVAGSCYGLPVNPSVAGSVGSVTHTGTGAGTVTPTVGPAFQILAKITTAGVLGTMKVAFSVNGGGYSNPVTSTVSTFSYLVPGTMTTLTFAAQTYTANDVWTITTAGGITVVGSGTAGWVTQASSPVDTYDVLLTIQAGGALGTATFTYSLDGGNSSSATVQVPSGGVYVIAWTGIILTFASTFVAGDTYEFTTVTAGFGTTDVGAALTALGASSALFFGVHIAGMGSSASAAASMAATVDTSLTAFATAYRYVMAIVECPQNDTDANIALAFASFSSNRVMITCTDILHSSSLNSGRTLRRNCGVVIATRLASTAPSEDPGFVGSTKGKLQNVTKIFRDSASFGNADILNNARFTVLTTRPTKTGFYCKTGNVMTQPGSDFTPVTNRRVMDIACTVAVGVAVNELNADLITVPGQGTIDPREASRLDGIMNAALANRLLKKSPPDVVAVNSAVDRTNNVEATETVNWTVQVVPKAKAKQINLTLGFQV